MENKGRMLFCRALALFGRGAAQTTGAESSSSSCLGPEASEQLWRLVFSELLAEALLSLHILAQRAGRSQGAGGGGHESGRPRKPRGMAASSAVCHGASWWNETFFVPDLW